MPKFESLTDTHGLTLYYHIAVPENSLIYISLIYPKQFHLIFFKSVNQLSKVEKCEQNYLAAFEP